MAIEMIIGGGLSPSGFLGGLFSFLDVLASNLSKPCFRFCFRSGGVVTAVCPNLSKLYSFEERILVVGRRLLPSLCSNSLGLYKRVHIINLHKYRLSGGQVSGIGQELDNFSEQFGPIQGQVWNHSW